MQKYPQNSTRKKTSKKYICGEKRTYVEKEAQINRLKKKTHNTVSGKRLITVHLRRETCVCEKRPRKETYQTTNARHL